MVIKVAQNISAISSTQYKYVYFLYSKKVYFYEHNLASLLDGVLQHFVPTAVDPQQDKIKETVVRVVIIFPYHNFLKLC